MTTYEAEKRIKEIREEIEREQVSYSEIAELQSLAPFISKDDVQMLEWADVPETN